MTATITIRQASTPAEFELAKGLFIAYQQYLGVDLCFQSFEKELTILDTMYAGETGSLMLAWANEEPAGCVAVRHKSDGTCEMKRLYVPDAYRGLGVGRQLAVSIMQEARRLGYTTMVLDTLETLQPAIGLYESLGFTRCNPYYANPLAGVVYMQTSL